MRSLQPARILAGSFTAICRKTFSWKTITVALVLLIGISLSPRFLAYSDTPRESDVIILFPGPELETMIAEARQLIGSGYAKYFCIPTSFSLYQVDQNRDSLTAVRFPAVMPGFELHPGTGSDISMPYFLEIRRECGFPSYFENTHVEMLLAKKVMDARGFKKAIFVSYPYHMRRIRIMAGRVFDPTYDIKLVPTRFEESHGGFLPLWHDQQHVISEYLKLAWYLCYDY